MDKLARYYNKMPILLSVQMNLLNKCYQKCIGCRKYTWPEVQLDFGTVSQFLNSYSNLHSEKKTIVYSGGEPLLYSKINETLKLTIDKNISYGILTSALFPSSVDLEFLIKNASYISISVDGSTKEMFQKTRGIDAFDKVIENIKLFKKIKDETDSRCKLRINSTISNINSKCMPDILKLASELKIECNFFPIHTWKDLKVQLNEEKLYSIEEDMLITFSKSFQHSIKTNIKDFYDMMKRSKPTCCIVPNFHLFIDANGDVLPCCRLACDNDFYKRNQSYIIGNINTSNIVDIWNSDNISKVRNNVFDPKYPECEECDRYNEMNSYYKIYLDKDPVFL